MKHDTVTATPLQCAVSQFLAKVDGGDWVIHASHLDPLRNAATEADLQDAVSQFLAKVDREGWAIHASHLASMREAAGNE